MSGGPTPSPHITGSCQFFENMPHACHYLYHSLILLSLVYLVGVKHSSASHWFPIISAQVLSFFLILFPRPSDNSPFPITKQTQHEAEREN